MSIHPKTNIEWRKWLERNHSRPNGIWLIAFKLEALEIPPDLRMAFKCHPGSNDNFDAFPRSTERAILESIGNAKTVVTRENGVSETATLAAEKIRANQWAKKQ